MLGLGPSLAFNTIFTEHACWVTSTDVLTFSSVAILLCTAPFFASLIPAGRAARVDPIAALRYD